MASASPSFCGVTNPGHPAQVAQALEHPFLDRVRETGRRPSQADLFSGDVRGHDGDVTVARHLSGYGASISVVILAPLDMFQRITCPSAPPLARMGCLGLKPTTVPDVSSRPASFTDS